MHCRTKIAVDARRVFDVSPNGVHVRIATLQGTMFKYKPSDEPLKSWTSTDLFQDIQAQASAPLLGEVWLSDPHVQGLARALCHWLWDAVGKKSITPYMTKEDRVAIMAMMQKQQPRGPHRTEL